MHMSWKAILLKRAETLEEVLEDYEIRYAEKPYLPPVYFDTKAELRRVRQAAAEMNEEDGIDV